MWSGVRGQWVIRVVILAQPESPYWPLLLPLLLLLLPLPVHDVILSEAVHGFIVSG
jgi:hypothetical protein